MAKRKWFSGLVQGLKKLRHIIFRLFERDVQVSKTWTLGEKLSEVWDNFKAKASNLYTYLVKVGKCLQVPDVRWFIQVIEVYVSQRRNGSELVDDGVNYPRRIIWTYIPPKNRSSIFGYLEIRCGSTHDIIVITLNERMVDLRCLNMTFSSGLKTLAGSLGKDEE